MREIEETEKGHEPAKLKIHPLACNSADRTLTKLLFPMPFPALLSPRRALHRASLFAFIPLFTMPAFSSATPLPVFFGNYSDAIRAADFDAATGVLSADRPVAPLAKASFLAKSANARFLYAVSETGAGGLHAFAIDAERALTALNSRPSVGDGPCDIALSPDGRLVAAANYGGGSVIVYHVQPDGHLGEQAFFSQHTHATNVFEDRQKKPHAHGVTWSPDGRFLLVPDLGGDRVYVYANAASASVSSPATSATSPLAPHAVQPWIEVPAGAGPRHAQFSADARHLYIINELGNTVSVVAYQPNSDTTASASATAADTFTLIETVSTLPAEGFAGATKTAEIVVHPAGHTVYASNRGADTLAVFARDSATGRLTPRGHVAVPANPRHFALSPDARWLLSASQDSSVVAVFAVDATTGALTPAGTPFATPQPVCVRF
jgi:6-phosphogluconolactonase